ncbi:MAG: BREX-6 system BrxE protein [Pirellulaceae bacterium]
MTETETRTLIPQSVIDSLLTAQLAIAWAGEGGEEPRLGWWRSDLKSEFGGEDFFRRLLPSTWEWAVFQSMREAARRRDAQLREPDHDADRILSLYCLGFEIDERADERLMEFKRAGTSPLDALPGLKDVVAETWDAERFLEWLEGHGAVDFTKVPAGRRLKGKQPVSLELTVQHLVAGFRPLSETYSLPHYRRST